MLLTKSSTPKELYLVIALTLPETLVSTPQPSHEQYPKQIYPRRLKKKKNRKHKTSVPSDWEGKRWVEAEDGEEKVPGGKETPAGWGTTAVTRF